MNLIKAGIAIALSVIIVTGVLFFSFSLNRYILLSVIYNTGSRTSEVVNTEFNSFEKCREAKVELDKGGEFPYQQYFIIKGGCFKK